MPDDHHINSVLLRSNDEDPIFGYIKAEFKILPVTGKSIDELFSECEHDGSFIPVSEVKRLMEAYRPQSVIGHLCKVNESCGDVTNDEIWKIAWAYAEKYKSTWKGHSEQDKYDFVNGFEQGLEYRQQPVGDDKFSFAVWLTGHNEVTIKQMYDDFCNSGKDAFQPLTQMPQYNRAKTSANTETQPRTDADWQELVTLRAENATLKEMVAKREGVDLNEKLVKFIRWYHKRSLIEHINTDEYLIDRYLKLQTP